MLTPDQKFLSQDIARKPISQEQLIRSINGFVETPKMWGESDWCVPYMERCIELSRQQKTAGYAPIVCILVCHERKPDGSPHVIEATDENLYPNPGMKFFPMPHAEIVALNKANNDISNHRGAFQKSHPSWPRDVFWTAIGNVEPCSSCFGRFLEWGVTNFAFAIPSRIGAASLGLTDNPHVLKSYEQIPGEYWCERGKFPGLNVTGGMRYREAMEVFRGDPAYWDMLKQVDDHFSLNDLWYYNHVVVPAVQGRSLDEGNHLYPETQYIIGSDIPVDFSI